MTENKGITGASNSSYESLFDDEMDSTLSFSEALTTIKRALQYAKPFKRRYALKIFISLLASSLMLFMPWPAKLFLDYVVGDSKLTGWLGDLLLPLGGGTQYGMLIIVVIFQGIMLLVIGAVTSDGGDQDAASSGTAGGVDQAGRAENQANRARSGISGLLGLFEVYWSLTIAQRINHLFRSQLYQRFQRLPLTAYSDQRIGDAVFRTIADSAVINQVIDLVIVMPIFALFTAATAFYLQIEIFGEQRFILWANIASIPLGLFVGIVMTARMRKTSMQMREAGSNAISTVEEGLASILAVKAFGQEEAEKEKFDEASWKSFSEFRRIIVLIILFIFFLAIPGLGLTFWVIYKIFMLIHAGVMTFGDLALLGFYAIRITMGAIFFSTLWFTLQDPLMGLRRVFSVMDRLGDAPDGPGAVPLTEIKKGLAFENVSAEYITGSPVLHGASFSTEVGKTLAIVGYAGSGKTTLVSCIPRFIEASAGSVSIDGIEIHGFTAESLRDQVSFVFQEDALISGTIAENIAYGKPDATIDEIKHAATIACSADFIQAFPDGYDSELGRRGSKLSVGQKQRICIARALLKNSSILIFDEPTSALDAKTEGKLLHSLKTELKDKIVIIIAHRLSTIRTADHILFMETGKIIEQGSFSELRSMPGGRFAHFCDIQQL